MVGRRRFIACKSYLLRAKFPISCAVERPLLSASFTPGRARLDSMPWLKSSLVCFARAPTCQLISQRIGPSETSQCKNRPMNGPNVAVHTPRAPGFCPPLCRIRKPSRPGLTKSHSARTGGEDSHKKRVTWGRLTSRRKLLVAHQTFKFYLTPVRPAVHRHLRSRAGATKCLWTVGGSLPPVPVPFLAHESDRQPVQDRGDLNRLDAS